MCVCGNISYLVGCWSFVCRLLEFYIYEQFFMKFTDNITSERRSVEEREMANERESKCVSVCVSGTYQIQATHTNRSLIHYQYTSFMCSMKKKKLYKHFLLLYSFCIYFFSAKTRSFCFSFSLISLPTTAVCANT